MAVEEGNKVAIEYTLTLNDGSTVESNVGKDPLVYVHGEGKILGALEKAIDGMDIGEEAKVQLAPEQAYGEPDPEAFQAVEPGMVPESARQTGQLLTYQDQAGNTRPVRVHEVKDDTIVLDFNHPLAGESLTFDVRVVGIE